MGSKHIGKKGKKKSSVENNQTLFRRTAIATALTMAVAPVNIATAGSRSTPWGAPWNRNIEIFFMPSTDRDPLLGAQLLQPLYGNAQSLSYADIRAIYNIDSTNEFNIGLGHRRYYGKDWLIGGYFSFDTRESDRNKRHSEVTFGLEALSRQWDVNFNYYLPITDPKVVGIGTNGGTFIGTRFLANGVVEEALEGFDIEVGALVPYITYGETRIYLGGYYFDGDVAPSTGAGIKGRIEFRPRKNINLGVTVQNDDLFGTEALFQLKYSFGYPNEKGVRTLDERMVQFHERDIDVKETSELPNSIMESSNPQFRTVVFNNVVHIDNVKGSASGNGSFERPYDSFATCIGKRCDSPNTVVYVGAGGKSSTVTTYDTTTFNLANNQMLFGRGFKLYGFGGDAYTKLTAAGNAVVLAKNNEIAGFQIDGAGNNGIYGFNSTGFNIHNNKILNSGNSGIWLTYDKDMPTSVSGTIDKNIIANNANYGVEIYTSLNGALSGSISQAFDINNNSITNNGDDGIAVYTYIYNNGLSSFTLNQTVNIANNTIKNNDDGIHIDNYVGDLYVGNATTLNQVIAISGNTISDNNDNGIHIYNETDSDTSVLNQTLTITNNTITNNNSDGIYIDFYNDYFSTIRFKGEISGNTITGNGDDGIDFNFDTYELGRNNIDLLVDSNTVTGNADNGIEIYLDSAYGRAGSSQKIVINNNTISNNGGDGIYIDTFKTSDGVVSQVITISNNTINNNAQYGVKIYNYAYTSGFGSFSQTVNLTGNTIKNNGVDGVRLFHYNTGDSLAKQFVKFTNNTITGNGRYDVAIYNYDSNQSIQKVTSGGGNTIGTIYVDGDGAQSVTLP